MMYCKSAVLTAPDSSTLIVTVNPGTIPLGGEALVRVVGHKYSGTPLPDGTMVYFSTDIGSIESNKEIKNGSCEVIFHSDNRSGVATLSVTSGRAETMPEEITVTIGASAFSSMSISADPAQLPLGGGVVTIRAVAYDDNLNPLANVPVIFSTDKGTLTSKGNTLQTNASGIVEDLLTTTEDATITAKSGDQEVSVSVTVTTNDDPVPDFEFSPSTPKVNEKIYFNASLTTDDGHIVHYAWDFGDGKSAVGITSEHRYQTPDSYIVVLSVTDNSGKTVSTSKSVGVSEAVGPTAEFTKSPENPTINETIYFDASPSKDSTEASINSWSWNFGDNSVDSGERVQHSYSAAGTYAVVLTVTDTLGKSDTYQEVLTIGIAQGPTATFSYTPTAPEVNQAVRFDASDSTAGEGSITNYSWDFGNGDVGSGKSISYTYTTGGSYNVVLTVTDSNGNSDDYTATIKIGTGKSPIGIIEIFPSPAIVGQTVNFSGAQSTDEDGSIVSYQWSFGDGETALGATVTHIYTVSGSFTVRLTVTDNDDNTNTVTSALTVNEDAAPTVKFTISPSTVNVGISVQFNASESTDDGTIVTYSWDFGDGSTFSSSSETAAHTYTAAGTYSVVLTLTDDVGNTASLSKPITVN